MSHRGAFDSVARRLQSALRVEQSEKAKHGRARTRRVQAAVCTTASPNPQSTRATPTRGARADPPHECDSCTVVVANPPSALEIAGHGAAVGIAALFAAYSVSEHFHPTIDYESCPYTVFGLNPARDVTHFVAWMAMLVALWVITEQVLLMIAYEFFPEELFRCRQIRASACSCIVQCLCLFGALSADRQCYWYGVVSNYVWFLYLTALYETLLPSTVRIVCSNALMLLGKPTETIPAARRRPASVAKMFMLVCFCVLPNFALRFSRDPTTGLYYAQIPPLLITAIGTMIYSVHQMMVLRDRARPDGIVVRVCGGVAVFYERNAVPPRCPRDTNKLQ